MPWQVWPLLAYACAVVYSYIHLHHKYGKTHWFLALLWPIVACVFLLPLKIIQHFTNDGKQFGR